MWCRFDGRELLVRSHDGGLERRLQLPMEEPLVGVCLRSDGAMIAVLCATALYVGALDGGALERVRTGVSDFAWFPDGSRLVVCCEGPSVVSLRADGTDAQTHYVNRHLRRSFLCPAVSPDGARVAFRCYKGSFRLALLEMASSRTDVLKAASGFAWLDAQRVLTGTDRVQVLDVATGRSRAAIRGDTSGMAGEVALVNTRMPHVHAGRVLYVQDVVLNHAAGGSRCVRQVRSVTTTFADDRVEAEVPRDYSLIGYYPVVGGLVVTCATRPVAMPDSWLHFGPRKDGFPAGYTPLPSTRSHPLAHGAEHWLGWRQAQPHATR